MQIQSDTKDLGDDTPIHRDLNAKVPKENLCEPLCLLCVSLCNWISSFLKPTTRYRLVMNANKTLLWLSPFPSLLKAFHCTG
jgi:hypothetical protein